MRKTRLVILPTKCLNQMGFLLLFLSCPVIGDWGRIRPDNENLQRAIEVEREGTCGLRRDTPGGFLDFTDDKGLNIRRFRDDNDLNIYKVSRFSERQNSRRAARHRLDEMRSDRRMEPRREQDSQERSIRSRSVEPRRNDRNDIRVRALSLNRQENVRRMARRESARDRRDNERVEQQERERMTAMRNERMRSSRRRESERSVQRLSLQRREDEMRRQDRNVQETGRLLSLSRKEENSRNFQRFESRGASERTNFERRQPEIRKVRNDVRVEAGKSVRSERHTDSTVKNSEQSVRDGRQMKVLTRRVESSGKARRGSDEMDRREVYPEDETGSFFTSITKFMNLENYEMPTIGDLSRSCAIGAVAYHLSTRQIKAT